VSDTETESTRPPEPPPFDRRLTFGRRQAAGIALLLLLPLMAVLGLLDGTQATATATSAGLAARIDYPARSRYRDEAELRVTVHNASAAVLPDVTVGWPRDYVDAFQQLSLIPAADVAGERAFQVLLGDLAPGDTRVVQLSGVADTYGWHRGRVTVATGAGSTVALDVRTLVIP
jgi:hypothetical protein